MNNPPMPDGGARRFAAAGSRAFGAWALEAQRRKRIAANAPSFTSDPTIDITDPEVGDTLEVSNGVVAPDEIYDYAYQWLRDAVAIVAATAKTYTAVLADADAVLTCRVTATSRQGFGSATATSADTDPVGGGGGPSAPDAPTGLVATPGDQVVVLEWDDAPGVTWAVFKDGVVVTTGLTNPAIEITGLQNGISHSYTVKANDGTLNSDPSDAVDAMSFWVISGLNITSRSDSGFTFAWSSLTTTLPEKLHYQVKETAASWGSPVAEADVAQNAESVDIGGLDPNKQYDLRVYAIDGANEGEKNGGLGGQFTLITTPANFTALARDEDIVFNWDSGGGAQTWRLFKEGTQVGADLSDPTATIATAFGETDSAYTLQAMNPNGNVSAIAGPLTSNRITYPSHAAFVLNGVSGGALDNYSAPFGTVADAIAAFMAAYHTRPILRVRGNISPEPVFLDGDVLNVGLTIIGHGSPPYTVEANLIPQTDTKLNLEIQGIALTSITWGDYTGSTPVDAAAIVGVGSIGTITAKGANGADGSDAAAGSNDTGSSGSTGSDGDTPGDGGNGGDANSNGGGGGGGLNGSPGRNIEVDAVAVATMELSGGNAGHGGAGGAGGVASGGAGGNGGNATTFENPMNGGNGGDGGSAVANGGSGANGGNGGDGGTCTRSNGATVTVFISNAGSGGSAGVGGGAGTAFGGSGGTGGSGANGGSAGMNGSNGSGSAGAGGNGSNGSSGTPGSLM